MHKIFGIINQNGWWTFIILALASTILSTIGFVTESSEKTFEWVMVGKALVQSFADLPNDDNIYLVLGKIGWILGITSAAVSVFLKEWSYKQLVRSIQDNDHTIVIGINPISQIAIQQMDTASTVVLNVSEEQEGNGLQENGYAVKTIAPGNIKSTLKIGNITYMLINTGIDRDNINTAFEMINAYIDEKCEHVLKLVVQIENKELNGLFRSSALFNDEDFKKSQIELKTYSFFEECAMKLFQDNSIDGETREIIDSDEEYSIIVAGDGELAAKIVIEAAKMAHLPNQNLLNIHLVCDNMTALLKKLRLRCPHIEDHAYFPHLRLHTIVLDYKSIEYYTHDIWHSKNLTNAIVCYDDENCNLEIASSLNDKTYLRHHDPITKVLFGVFNQEGITKTIDDDIANYKLFKSFGNASDILSRDNLFDDESYQIAKMINYTYDGLTEDGKYSPLKTLSDQSAVNHTWYHNAVYSDKQSSLAQAKHIVMKLKALGFTVVKSDQPIQDLLGHNREMIDGSFDVPYNGHYPFPESFDDTLFHKMIRMEHNRWNAFHFVNGWEYEEYLNIPKAIKKEKKKIRLHNCLLPIEQFKSTQFIDNVTDQEAELVTLIEWDIYAFMYMPNYLAEARYEIVSMKGNIQG